MLVTFVSASGDPQSRRPPRTSRGDIASRGTSTLHALGAAPMPAPRCAAASPVSSQGVRNDPVGQLAKLGVGLLGLFERVGDQRQGVLIILCPQRELECDNRVHEPLLGGVV